MAHDDIPENEKDSHQCPNCEDGTVSEIDDGVWECDTCQWQHVVSNSKNNQAGYIY